MRLPTIFLLLLSPLLAACGSDTFSSDTKLFPSQVKFFSSQDWATATKATGPDLIAAGPAPGEELVDANGRCGVQGTQTDVAVGTVAGDLGSSTAAQPTTPTVAGGVALGMSECQVVARAGQPGQVNIGAEPGNERKTVLTYNSGPWPGTYTFSAGRLKDIQAVAQVEQPKPVKKKTKAARSPTTASTR